MIIRRDKDGLLHWAGVPSPYAYRAGLTSTGAKCDMHIDTYGNLQNVPQDGPTCLWCVQGIKR